MVNKSREELVGIGATREENFSDWYNEVVQKSGLADYAPISGCMVIKPYAYSMWEKIRGWFDRKIKETGVENAYFPMFIPESFFQKEAEHFEGFTPEVAWIEKKEQSDERYALRPTSETIIYDTFSKWIRSWRDLPLRINQWCNIVRWECKATRLFLRTREFLWQEGHTAHATNREASDEAMLRAEQYRELMESQLAVPVLMGRKSKSEAFAGALYTMTLEALMPDGKALQMGTTHNLGQHFAKVFDIEFKDKDKEDRHAWQTSWGISTRLIGSVVMTHGDDKGLVLPPRIAPLQMVIVPIYKTSNRKTVLREASKLEKELSGDFSVKLDDRDEYSPGWKFNEWEMKGVPLRIEIGPRDIESKQVMGVRRDTGEKIPIRRKLLTKKAKSILEDIQNNLYAKAKSFLESSTVKAGNYEDLKRQIREGRLVKAHWCGNESCEEKIKEDTSATIRLIEGDIRKGQCIHCKKQSKHMVYFAKAY